MELLRGLWVGAKEVPRLHARDAPEKSRPGAVVHAPALVEPSLRGSVGLGFRVGGDSGARNPSASLKGPKKRAPKSCCLLNNP